MDSKVLSKMQRLCARREYCASDIRGKILKSMDGDEEGAAEVLDALMRDGFVDDRRYASAFARDKSSLAGWGTAKISFALARKGIGKAVIQEAVGKIEPERAGSKMRAVIESKWRSLAGDENAKLKLLRYALGRGYSYDEVRQVVDEISSRSGKG